MNRIFAFVVAALLITSCAHSPKELDEDEAYTKNKPPGPVAPVPMGSDYLSAAISGIAVIYSMSQIPQGTKAEPYVFGSCKAANPEVYEPCKSAYVRFVRLSDKQESNVWLNENGAFQFRINSGEKYEVQAFSEKYGTYSQPIVISKPGRLRLTIDPSAKSGRAH